MCTFVLSVRLGLRLMVVPVEYAGYRENALHHDYMICARMMECLLSM